MKCFMIWGQGGNTSKAAASRKPPYAVTVSPRWTKGGFDDTDWLVARPALAMGMEMMQRYWMTCR